MLSRINFTSLPQWLLSHIIIVKIVVRSPKGMNPVAITIINPRKEIGFDEEAIIFSFPHKVCNGNFIWVINTFPNIPWFLGVCSTSLLKTPWKKEKLLVTSNFSFFHSVFYLFGEFLSFSLNSKLSSANSFSFEGSKICHLVKG